MSSVASSSHVLRSAPQANSIANAVVDMELDGGDDCKCKYPATVLGVSCTSMSFCVGEKTVDEQLKAFDPATPVTDMARGQLQALLALGARKVALMTPYIEEVSAANQRMLEAGGVEVVYRLTMGLEKDEQTTAVDPEVIKEWALAANCDEADCVVIGCSAFRACGDGFIDDLEKALGKPVVTSTQAFLWAIKTRKVR